MLCIKQGIEIAKLIPHWCIHGKIAKWKRFLTLVTVLLISMHQANDHHDGVCFESQDRELKLKARTKDSQKLDWSWMKKMSMSELVIKFMDQWESCRKCHMEAAWMTLCKKIETETIPADEQPLIFTDFFTTVDLQA